MGDIRPSSDVIYQCLVYDHRCIYGYFCLSFHQLGANMVGKWITDRRPTPQDAGESGHVLVSDGNKITIQHYSTVSWCAVVEQINESSKMADGSVKDTYFMRRKAGEILTDAWMPLPKPHNPYKS
jgi:hypothetical protein